MPLSYSTRYDTGSEMLGDADCQRKAVCEVYQQRRRLGEAGRRARHSLDFLGDAAGYLALPDAVANTLDEFQVRRGGGGEGSNVKWSCLEKKC